MRRCQPSDAFLPAHPHTPPVAACTCKPAANQLHVQTSLLVQTSCHSPYSRCKRPHSPGGRGWQAGGPTASIAHAHTGGEHPQAWRPAPLNLTQAGSTHRQRGPSFGAGKVPSTRHQHCPTRHTYKNIGRMHSCACYLHPKLCCTHPCNHECTHASPLERSHGTPGQTQSAHTNAPWKQ